MPQLESSRRGSAPGTGPHGTGRPRPQVLPPCTQAPPQRLHRAGLGCSTASWGSRESHPDTGSSPSPSWVLWVWMVHVCMGARPAQGTQRTPPSSPAGAKPGVPSPALSPRHRVSRSLRAGSAVCWAQNPMAGDRQVSSAWKGQACGPAHGSPKQREPHAQMRPRVTACLSPQASLVGAGAAAQPWRGRRSSHPRRSGTQPMPGSGSRAQGPASHSAEWGPLSVAAWGWATYRPRSQASVLEGVWSSRWGRGAAPSPGWCQGGGHPDSDIPFSLQADVEPIVTVGVSEVVPRVLAGEAQNLCARS